MYSLAVPKLPSTGSLLHPTKIHASRIHNPSFHRVRCFHNESKHSTDISPLVKFINIREKISIPFSPSPDVSKSPFDAISKYVSSSKNVIATSLIAFALTLTFGSSPVNAADTLNTCLCLLRECRKEFVGCLEDPKCAANIACLQTCNDRPDETDCQIKCGDLFEDPSVDAFNRCAITEKGCVPQKQDEGLFPEPPFSAVVPKFQTNEFDGAWYISSGLNKTFDVFDCQLHTFTSEPGRMTGQLSWRIKTPDGGFFTRRGEQSFVQDPDHPGILYNHDNEFLHYQDDWYILSKRTVGDSDDYILVYYRGKNDAWDGYGGAVLYTRARTVPTSIVPELETALNGVGLNFSKFTATDNTCGPQLPLYARLEKTIENQLIKGEKALEDIEQNIETLGRTEVKLFTELVKGIQEVNKDGDIFLKELSQEEKALLGRMDMEADDIDDLFSSPIPIRKRR